MLRTIIMLVVVEDVVIGRIILRGNGPPATTIKIYNDTQVDKEQHLNLVTYEINGDRDTDTIYICAHGPQMVKDIMKHYIVRDVIEKGKI